jgi:hypothetical protein
LKIFMAMGSAKSLLYAALMSPGSAARIHAGSHWSGDFRVTSIPTLAPSTDLSLNLKGTIGVKPTNGGNNGTAFWPQVDCEDR